ncbi:MAG: hypothetical protein H0W63_09045 [Gemmatimonadaceae bacterium]|nr:hypothetical protein [Gemmatimonadaceae bacterium]
MTDREPAMAETGSEGMRRLLKRAGHELRNAQNAVAVNLEVVRSRIAAGKTEKAAFESFADNAAQGAEESARLGDALVALCGAASDAMTAGVFKEGQETSGAITLEFGMAPDHADIFLNRISALTARAGFSAEAAPAGVILRIPPDNERNRA